MPNAKNIWRHQFGSEKTSDTAGNGAIIDGNLWVEPDDADANVDIGGIMVKDGYHVIINNWAAKLAATAQPVATSARGKAKIHLSKGNRNYLNFPGNAGDAPTGKPWPNAGRNKVGGNHMNVHVGSADMHPWLATDTTINASQNVIAPNSSDRADRNSEITYGAGHSVTDTDAATTVADANFSKIPVRLFEADVGLNYEVDAPDDSVVALDYTFYTPPSTSKTHNVTGNYRGSLPITVAITVAPSAGTATVTAENEITYTSGASLGNVTLTYSITDGVTTDTGVITMVVENNSISISVAPATLVEGTSGTQNIVFTVTRSGGNGLVRATWTKSGTSNDADFASGAVFTGQVDIPIGRTTETITFVYKGDETVESNETVIVTLTDPIYCTIGTASATCTVTDSGGAATVRRMSITSNASTVAEGGAVTLRINRSGLLTGSCSVVWTAVSSLNTDNDLSGTITGTSTFAASDTENEITIQTVNRTATNGTRTVTVTLSSPTGGEIISGQGAASFTITDRGVARTWRSNLPWASGVTFGGLDPAINRETNSFREFRGRQSDIILLYTGGNAWGKGATNPNIPVADRVSADDQYERVRTQSNLRSSSGLLADALNAGFKCVYAHAMLCEQEKGLFDRITVDNDDNRMAIHRDIIDEMADWFIPWMDNHPTAPPVIFCFGQENTGGYPWAVRSMPGWPFGGTPASPTAELLAKCNNYKKAYKRLAYYMDKTLNTGSRIRHRTSTGFGVNHNPRVEFSWNAMNNWMSSYPGLTCPVHPLSADWTVEGANLRNYNPIDWFTSDCYDHEKNFRTGAGLGGRTGDAAWAYWIGSEAVNDNGATGNNGPKSHLGYAKRFNCKFGIQEWFPGVKRDPKNTVPDEVDRKNYPQYIDGMWGWFKSIAADTPELDFFEIGFNQTTDILCHDLWPRGNESDRSNENTAVYGYLETESDRYKDNWTPRGSTDKTYRLP
jgi:hypothetical protein